MYDLKLYIKNNDLLDRKLIKKFYPEKWFCFVNLLFIIIFVIVFYKNG